ncbi:MAG: FAD-dependent oxidoreductase [Candidatus Omnitrophota bacterium]
MFKKKIVILGGGLAGLSAAWHLQKKGRNCLVFEKEPEVGGLCRSKNINGFIFDYDGHLLHFRHKYTFDFVCQLLGRNLARHDRNASIYTNSKYLRFPFQANLYGLPARVAKECLFDFIQANQNHHHEEKNHLNFSSWIHKTFGKGIARHFMVPYNRKFWTVEPKHLTCEWLDGFIPVPSLAQVIEGTIEESKRQFGYNARFWYPRIGGIQELARAFASGLKGIHTFHQVVKIDMKNKQVHFSHKLKQKYDILIFSLPLPELSHLAQRLPSSVTEALNGLRCTSIFNLNLGIGRPHLSDKHWVYFPDKRYVFFRVGFPVNFAPQSAPKGTSSLYVEVAHSQERPINKNTICHDIIRDLIRARILDASDKILTKDVNDIPYGYIIYDQKRSRALARIRDFLRENDIYGLGRYGTWSYMSMEDCLLDGKRVAGFL